VCGRIKWARAYRDQVVAEEEERGMVYFCRRGEKKEAAPCEY